MEELKSFLEPYLVWRESGGSEGYFSISEEGLAALAGHNGITLKEAAMGCLDNGIWPERYRAQKGTFTADDQARLLKSSVAVIGAGGLGGTVSILLARAGLGRLIVCDGDRFDQSNLNRQLLSNLNRLGRHKAVCAAEEIQSFNPLVEVVVFTDRAVPENVRDILKTADLVIDCLDNLESRFMVLKAARELKIPFIHGALAGREGMVMPVFPEDPGLEALYGESIPSKENSAETILGTPTVTPAVVAGLEVEQAIQVLLEKKTVARRRLLHLDLTLPSIDAMALG